MVVAVSGGDPEAALRRLLDQSLWIDSRLDLLSRAFPAGGLAPGRAIRCFLAAPSFGAAFLRRLSRLSIEVVPCIARTAPSLGPGEIFFERASSLFGPEEDSRTEPAVITPAPVREGTAAAAPEPWKPMAPTTADEATEDIFDLGEIDTSLPLEAAFAADAVLTTDAVFAMDAVPGAAGVPGLPEDPRPAEPFETLTPEELAEFDRFERFRRGGDGRSS